MFNFEKVRSILVINDKIDHALYISQFAEYLKNDFIVLNAEAFNELDVIKNDSFRNVFSIEGKSFKQTDNASKYMLFSEKPSHVSIGFYDLQYSKGFAYYDDSSWAITFDSNAELIKYPLPIGYCYNEALDCIDSESNSYCFDDDTKFSYSCGYYDSSEMIIINSSLYEIDDTVILHNGKRAHIDDVVYCDELEEYYLYSDCTQLENGEYLPDDMTIRTADGCYYSQNDDNIYSCDGCDDHFHCDDLHYHENSGGSYCENCRPENGLQNRLSYSTDVIDYHGFGDHQNKINGKKVFIGFELECLAFDDEVENLDDSLKDMKYGYSGFNYCVPTCDGSLDDDFGVEFIFKPDSLCNHSENLLHFVDNLDNYLYTSAGNGYGLHVHVSNNFLSNFDKIKIQNFSAIHDSKLRFIGGRDETNYQPKKMLSKTSDMKKGNVNKYQAVNISPNNTIEFRFPVSLVDHEHIMRNLQLAYSICLYVKYHCNYTNIGDFDLYLNWLKSEKDFKLLSEYFAQL